MLRMLTVTMVAHNITNTAQTLIEAQVLFLIRPRIRVYWRVGVYLGGLFLETLLLLESMVTIYGQTET